MSTSTETTTGIDATDTDAAATDGTRVGTRSIPAGTLARRGLMAVVVVVLSLALVRLVAGMFVPLGGIGPAS